MEGSPSFAAGHHLSGKRAVPKISVAQECSSAWTR